MEERRQEAERLEREGRLRWAQVAEEAARMEQDAEMRQQDERYLQLAEATQEAEVQAMGPPPPAALAQTQGQVLAGGDMEVGYGGEEEVQGGAPSTDAGPAQSEEGPVGQLICASPAVKSLVDFDTERRCFVLSSSTGMNHHIRKVLYMRIPYLHARNAMRMEEKLDKDEVKSVLRELRAAWM